jgi:ribonuclease P protein component
MKQATDEENLPTRRAEAQTHPRIPCPYGYPWRTSRDSCPPRQRPQPTQRLSLLAPRLGLPKSCRILASTGYTGVLRGGKKTNDTLFSVITAPNQLPQARLGITVSRKVSPRAVQRNRIKRQVRESFRHYRLSLCGVDLVVIARPEAAKSDNKTLKAALQQHWERIQRQCRSS